MLRGTKSAAAPSSIKQSPMIGTTRTENEPAVTIAAPYSNSHVPGSNACSPACAKRVRQQAAHHDGRRKAQQKFAAGPGEQLGIGAMRLGGRGRSGNGHGDERFHQPNIQPALAASVCREAKIRRDQSGDAHGHAAPARHGGEFRGALHGFANVAKMVGGARVDGNRHAWK